MLVGVLKTVLVIAIVAFFAYRAFHKTRFATGSQGMLFEKGFGLEIAAAIGFSILVSVLLSAIVVIPGGSRGVVFSQGTGVEERILGEGMSFVIPVFENVHVYNVQRSTIDVDLGKGNAAASSDVQDVFVTVKITYRPRPEKVNMIWQEVGDRDSVEARILTPEVVQVLKSVIPRYAAAEIVTKREEIRAQTLAELNKRSTIDRYVEIFSISVANVEFQPEFRTLLEQKAQKTQELEIAKRNVEIAEQAKLKALTEASARAESQKTIADGEAYQNKVLAGSVTDKSLESRKIDVLSTLAGKWNGTFPTTWTNIGSGGAPLPLLNIDSLMKGVTAGQ